MQRRLLLTAVACGLLCHQALAQSRSAQSVPSREASAAAVAAQEEAGEGEPAAWRGAEEHGFNILLIALPAFGLLGVLFLLINGAGKAPPASPG